MTLINLDREVQENIVKAEDAFCWCFVVCYLKTLTILPDSVLMMSSSNYEDLLQKILI